MNPYVSPNSRISGGGAPSPTLGTSDRWPISLIAAGAALPLSYLTMLYTFALRAALYLGHWPYYGHPDPKDLPEQFDPPEFLELLIPALAFSFQAVLVVLLVKRFAGSARQLQAAGLIAISLWFLSLTLFLSDPVGVLDWIMD